MPLHFLKKVEKRVLILLFFLSLILICLLFSLRFRWELANYTFLFLFLTLFFWETFVRIHRWRKLRTGILKFLLFFFQACVILFFLVMSLGFLIFGFFHVLDKTERYNTEIVSPNQNWLLRTHFYPTGGATVCVNTYPYDIALAPNWKWFPFEKVVYQATDIEPSDVDLKQNLVRWINSNEIVFFEVPQMICKLEESLKLNQVYKKTLRLWPYPKIIQESFSFKRGEGQFYWSSVGDSASSNFSENLIQQNIRLYPFREGYRLELMDYYLQNGRDLKKANAAFLDYILYTVRTTNLIQDIRDEKINSLKYGGAFNLGNGLCSFYSFSMRTDQTEIARLLDALSLVHNRFFSDENLIDESPAVLMMREDYCEHRISVDKKEISRFDLLEQERRQNKNRGISNGVFTEYNAEMIELTRKLVKQLETEPVVVTNGRKISFLGFAKQKVFWRWDYDHSSYIYEYDPQNNSAMQLIQMHPKVSADAAIRAFVKAQKLKVPPDYKIKIAGRPWEKIRVLDIPNALLQTCSYECSLQDLFFDQLLFDDEGKEKSLTTHKPQNIFYNEETRELFLMVRDEVALWKVAKDCHIFTKEELAIRPFCSDKIRKK